jgi:hypothetical protein
MFGRSLAKKASNGWPVADQKKVSNVWLVVDQKRFKWLAGSATHQNEQNIVEGAIAQGCQMVKNQNLGKYRRDLHWKMYFMAT